MRKEAAEECGVDERRVRGEEMRPAEPGDIVVALAREQIQRGAAAWEAVVLQGPRLHAELVNPPAVVERPDAERGWVFCDDAKGSQFRGRRVFPDVRVRKLVEVG